VSEQVTVEATGETVGEAKWQAMRELERGLLGVGYTPARVIAAADAPSAAGDGQAPPELDSSEGVLVRELLGLVAGALGVPCTVSVDEREDEIVATLSGPDLGIVIGRHGQTIDALQYLANAMAHRAIGPDRLPITVDAAGYRARRLATLESVARQSAQRAAERKIVHELLKDDPEVETASEGSEPNRYVVIVPGPNVD
jgi:spoIIIJ-associated protein